ncbi:MAG: outer membrane beta-barrel protein [Polyangiales bacterium]
MRHLCLAAVALLAPSAALAQTTPAPSVTSAEATPGLRVPTGGDSALQLGGYVETYYSFNFNQPSNGITEFRAFDNRHNAFALQSVAVDVGWSNPHLAARLVLQAGTAPDTYYGASEPGLAGSALTPASDARAVRFVQQANLAWSPLPRRLVIDAGLFLSPIGGEGMATHANFGWSQSVMFFGLPFYHLGARVQWSPNARHALRLGVYNGWNNVLDNNDEKTLGLDYTFTPSTALTVGFAYFTGVERATSAPEGRAWRHLLDAHAQWQPSPRVQLLANVNAGLEPNAMGLSAWAAANVAARFKLTRWLYAAARATAFYERRASRDGQTAAAIAIPSEWIASGTATLEARPHGHVSFKLELRHDAAATPTYFSGAVSGDGAATPFAPNARSQTTLTLGATAWF